MPETLEKLPQPQQLETGREQMTGLDIINAMQPATADKISSDLLAMLEQLNINGLGMAAEEVKYTRQQIESAAILVRENRNDLTQVGKDNIGKITNNIKTFARK